MLTKNFRPFLLLIAWIAVQAQDGATHSNWLANGGNQGSWRYSALNQINRSNVRRLLPAWIFQTGDYSENLQCTPIVVEGVMYLITPGFALFALKADTGELIWEYRYPKPQRGRAGGMNFVQNRGVAVGEGLVIFGATENTLVALDARTGKEIWRVAVDDDKQCGCVITAAPLIMKDKVVVGGNGGDAADRGYLTDFDIRTGRVAWRW